METKHQSQRGFFAWELYERMKTNEAIYLLVGDLGYKMFDRHFQDFPDRCINCGASEQAMLGLAVGLAQAGKIPFVYTITSFFLRAAETISLYLDHEQANVKLIGSGRDQDYLHDGYSHDATRVQEYFKALHITSLYPKDKEEIPTLVSQMIWNNEPTFLSLRR